MANISCNDPYPFNQILIFIGKCIKNLMHKVVYTFALYFCHSCALSFSFLRKQESIPIGHSEFISESMFTSIFLYLYSFFYFLVYSILPFIFFLHKIIKSQIVFS